MAIPSIRSYEPPAASSWPVPRVDWSLDPSRAALLVHDMQSYFLRAYEPGAAPLGPMLANVRALLAVCARQGVPVFFSVQPGEQSRSERGLLWDMWGPGIVEHPDLTPLHEAMGAVDPRCIIEKKRYSAFYETTLHERMRALGRDQLLISGVYAHIGCLTTAQDGFMRGIQPFFLADATADFSAEDHAVALRQVARTCGTVLMTRDATRALEGPARERS